ncbi:MAG: efflux RND transporter periplasmic adaptor subunit [Betaproteobacteria bacterium]
MNFDWTVMKAPENVVLAFFCATLLCCLQGCEKPRDAVADNAPNITGTTIAFAADSPQLKNIQTAKVEGPRERELQLPGRLTWDEDRTVRVFTPFAGRVTRILASVGQRVDAGQALAELTSPDFGQAQADARKAEADLAAKTSQLNRVKELVAAGVAAGKDLQQAEADRHSADAEFRRASARVALFGGSNNVDQRFVLKSPLAGVVVEKTINPGQELRPDQPGAPLFVVTDPTKLWVQLDAGESDLKNLKIGAMIVVTTSQYPDDTFAGELRQVADFIDPVARTLKLRGSVPNADRRLKAEMFVSARMRMAKGENPTVIDKAVFLDGLRMFVFVKTAAGGFTRRAVRVGPSLGDTRPVLAGLTEGEEVVTSGALYLQQMLVEAGTKAAAIESGNKTDKK